MIDGMTEYHYEHVSQVAAGNGQLEDVMQVEDALILIKSLEDKADHLKMLKKRRVSSIDEQSKKIELNISNLRAAIANIMQSSKKKSVDFPDVAKVTLSNKKGTWLVKEQQKLESFLGDQGLLDSVSEMERVFNKKNLNSLLDELEKNKNLPDSVERDQAKNTVSISFSENINDKTEGIDSYRQYNAPQNATPVETSVGDNFDGLEI